MIFVLSKVWGFFGNLGWKICKNFKSFDKDMFGVWFLIVYFFKNFFKFCFDLFLLFLFELVFNKLFKIGFWVFKLLKCILKLLDVLFMCILNKFLLLVFCVFELLFGGLWNIKLLFGELCNVVVYVFVFLVFDFKLLLLIM